jgi:hypothetical protein
MPRLSVLAVLPSLFALSLRGDTVELKTGERLEGTFRQASASGVLIEVGGQPITLPLEKVHAIYFGAGKISSVVGPAPSQEAVDALKALRSVTESGISYRDYASRVLDAKVKVDRYLSSAANDGAALRSGIGLAMREYELASQAWSTAISTSVGTLAVATSVGRTLDGDPEISKCPAIRQWIDQTNQTAARSRVTRNNSPDQRAAMIGLLAGQRPALLWTCASAHVAEAERLLAQH